MGGVLQSSIIRDFEESFEYNCLVLFGEAYKYIKDNKKITVDWDEENISANIFDFIYKSGNAIAWNIDISDEQRLYYEDVLIGVKPAKTASRIDFRLTTNWTEQKKRYAFFVEAKNLIEINCKKTGVKTKIDANKLHKRYIKTGINNFVSGKYPQPGCLVGYILQGEPIKIVENINNILQTQNRTTEYLKQIISTIPFLDLDYKSTHNNGLLLKHFFLDFT